MIYLKIYFWVFLVTVVLNVSQNIMNAGKPKGNYSMGQAVFVLVLWVPFLALFFKEIY